MLSRAAIRTTSLVSRRGFSSTSAAKNHYHWPEGPYANIPFKIHNRKIPYFFIHWAFFGMYGRQSSICFTNPPLATGISAPFLIVYYQLKKSS